jgi:phosphatidylserine synthase
MATRRPMFGVKDLFTCVNLMGGVVAMCLCVDGRPFEAGVAVILGYVFGDALDGYVARRLGTSNRFGEEFDSIADHMSHVVAPAAIVYTVYRQAGLVPAPWDQVLAIALAGAMVVSVSIRHARNIVAPVNFKGVWVGLPRTVLGFWAIGYCNAEFATRLPGGLWFGVAFIPALCISTLTYWPFPSHHIQRRMFGWAIALLVCFFIAMGVALILAPRFLFDVVFLSMAIYAILASSTLTADERVAYDQAVAAARAAS